LGALDLIAKRLVVLARRLLVLRLEIYAQADDHSDDVVLAALIDLLLERGDTLFDKMDMRG
jgi:hypothetical protein